MKMIRTLALSMVLLHGMLVPVWAQTAELSTPPASDVKLRSAMTSQFQALQTRLANGKAMLQAIIACHEGPTKQFYVQRNATPGSAPGCFNPVSVLSTQPCPAGWEIQPGFGSNPNHCWWSGYENSCVGVNKLVVMTTYAFNRSTGAQTRTEDWSNGWYEFDSPDCSGSSSGSSTGYVEGCDSGGQT
jgi:hypothetical protein